MTGCHGYNPAAVTCFSKNKKEEEEEEEEEVEEEQKIKKNYDRPAKTGQDQRVHLRHLQQKL